MVTFHWFNILRQVNEINTCCFFYFYFDFYFCAILLLQLRAGVRPLTFFKWDLEVESRKKCQSMIEPAVQFSGKTLWTHTHTRTTKKAWLAVVWEGFLKDYTRADSPTWAELQSRATPSYLRRGNWNSISKGTPLLFSVDCPLSTVVRLKIMVIAHRFRRIESISMQMIPSYMMRLTDHDNK